MGAVKRRALDLRRRRRRQEGTPGMAASVKTQADRSPEV
jgi:hypothetical protein